MPHTGGAGGNGNDIEWSLLKGSVRLLILSLLEESPMYGYQILKRVGEFLGSKPKPSTIYTILAELERRGLVKSNTGLRKYYSLTGNGRRVLHEIRERSGGRIRRLISIILGGQKQDRKSVV